MTTSDTPRTDAAFGSMAYCNVEDEWKTAKKLLDLSRQLELELAAAAEIRERMKDPAYVKANPLGGPASMFRTMAGRIEAGESYEDVLRDYEVTVGAKPIAWIVNYHDSAPIHLTADKGWAIEPVMYAVSQPDAATEEAAAEFLKQNA